MRKAIAKMERHVVVAGAGSTGQARHRGARRHAARRSWSSIATSRTSSGSPRTSWAARMLYVHGDATDDHTLVDAGIERAIGRRRRAHARQGQPLRHAQRAQPQRRARASSARSSRTDADAEDAQGRRDLGRQPRADRRAAHGERAGAPRGQRVPRSDAPRQDEEPPHRGGHRPREARASSGTSLKDSPIRRETKLLVIAVRDKDRSFVYNPDPDHIIDGGTTLIVMGDAESVVKLRKILDESVPGATAAPTAPA